MVCLFFCWRSSDRRSNPQNKYFKELVICSDPVVRRHLASLKQSLSGLYSGNPKRQTSRPTAEQLLTAFSELTLYLYPNGSAEISSLNGIQKQILNLMNIPESIYLVPQLVPD